MNEIEICLNCKKPKCNGDCGDYTKRNRNYVIQRTKINKNGEVKKSYIYTFTHNIITGTDIFKARRFAKNEAKKAIEKLIKKSKTDVVFEMLKRDDEVNKNGKYDRTKDTYVLVDSDGNRIGVRNGSRND